MNEMEKQPVATIWSRVDLLLGVTIVLLLLTEIGLSVVYYHRHADGNRFAVVNAMARIKGVLRCDYCKLSVFKAIIPA
jgi:hypothetical protein